MARLRLVLALAIGLALGAVALSWVSHDRPFDAPRAHRHADAGVAVTTNAATVTATALAPTGAGVEVALVDARLGAPLAAVELAARTDGALAAITATTDDAGHARLPIAAGRWQVTATRGGAPLVLTSAEDWQLGPGDGPALIVRALPSAEVPPPLELPAVPPGPGALVGVVTLEGVHVSELIVTPIYLGDVGPGRTVVRDRVPQPTPLPARRFVRAAGVFRWDGLATGSYAVLVVAPDRGAAIVRTTVTADLAGDASVALAPAASLAGRAVDDHSNELPDTTIAVRQAGLPLARVTTDARGTFAVPDLPPGPIELVARHADCIGDSPAVTLVAGTRTTVPLGLLCGPPPTP